nr:unnamed protein product [Naegleria fowleri]
MIRDSSHGQSPLSLSSTRLIISMLVLSTMMIFSVGLVGATNTTSPSSSPSSPSSTNNLSSPITDRNEPPECTLNDYGATYTPCLKMSDIRTVVYYKKNNCSGGVPLPISTETLPCNLTCSNGQFLRPPFVKCEPCIPGEFSFSEGILTNDWEELPDSMKTSCVSEGSKNPKCSSWKVSTNYKYIHSGDQSDSTGTVSSVLTYYVDILRESGKLEFSFRVDADNGNGLELYIDNEQVLERTSYVHEYTIKSFALTKGYHVIEWRFEKASSPSSSTKQMAYIKWIKIYGDKLSVEYCTKCPTGTFNNEPGQASCSPCPLDTFNDQSGQTQCQPCPENTYALEGSTSCSPRPLCTALDYVAHYTPCSNGKRKLIYEWKKPKICNGGVELPKNKDNEECNQCPLGLFRKNDECQRCSGKGEYYDMKEMKCKKCYEGYYALKYLRYDSNFFNEITSLPSHWSTKCLGECDKENKGWTIVSNIEKNEAYLDAAANGYGDESVLSIPIELYTDGSISIEYELLSTTTTTDKTEDTSVLLFFVNRTLVGDFSRQTLKELKGTYKTRYYPAGHYLLTFAFEKYDSPNKQSTALIKSIVIEGEISGASDKCYECREGHYCPQGTDEHLPCRPGTYSNIRQEACMACYRNTFQNKWGQNRCLNCGDGTFSNAGSADCVNTCLFTVPGTEIMYNLTTLQSALNSELSVFGPLTLPNSPLKFYFNLCNKFDTAYTKFCQKESRLAVLAEQRKDVTTKNRRKGYTTYACVEDDSSENPKYHTSGDMGSTISYYHSPKGDGLTVYLATDYKCSNKNGVYNTKVELKCNPKEGIGKPVIATEVDETGAVSFADVCSTRILWESHAACPVCTIYDYEPVVSGECENGRRKKTWFLKPNAKCYPYSGLTAPLPEDVSCITCSQDDYTFVETKCVNGFYKRKYVWKEKRDCFGGVELPEDETLTCDEVEIGKLTAVTGLSVAAAVFLCLLVGICFFYFRNKQLYEQYEMLGQKETPDIEMMNSGSGVLELMGNESSSDDDMGFTTTKTINITDSDEDDRV